MRSATPMAAPPGRGCPSVPDEPRSLVLVHPRGPQVGQLALLDAPQVDHRPLHVPPALAHALDDAGVDGLRAVGQAPPVRPHIQWNTPDTP